MHNRVKFTRFVLLTYALLNPALSFAYEKVQLSKLAISPVTTMTLSPDGREVYFGHEKYDSISVFDTLTAKLVRKVECAAPRHILCRGDKKYVANYGNGTISVFNKEWKQVNLIEVGYKNVYYLTAPSDHFFNNVVLATAREPDRPQAAIVMRVNVDKDEHKELLRGDKLWTATLTYDGKRLILQDADTGLVSARDVLGKDFSISKESKLGKDEKTPFLHQWQNSRYWIGDWGVCYGMPPRPIKVNKYDNLIVPDRNLPVYYEFVSSRMHVRGLSEDSRLLERRIASPHMHIKRITRSKRRTPAQHSERVFYQQIAITLDNKLCFYILSGDSVKFGGTVGFAITEPVEVPDELIASVRLPSLIAVGKPLVAKLFGEKVQGKFTLLDSPEGMQISRNGEVRWTPPKSAVGVHLVKVHGVIDGKTSFFRAKIEVVSTQLADAVGDNLHKIADSGHFKFRGPLTCKLWSRDRSSMYFLAGQTLMQTDASGRVPIRQVKLSKEYKKIADREEYLIALSGSSVDLLSHETLEVIKSIKISVAETYDLAAHPGQLVSYVTAYNSRGGRRNAIEAQRVLLVNEVNGKVTEVPRMYGTLLAADPTGKYLFVALRAKYEKGLIVNPKLKKVYRDVGEIDVLFSFDIRSRIPKHLMTNSNPGVGGSQIVVSPNGEYVAYVSSGGHPPGTRKIPLYKSSDIREIQTSYSVKEPAKDLCFHPVLDKVMISNGNRYFAFNSLTGEPTTGASGRLKTEEDVMISPDGTRVLASYDFNVVGVKNTHVHGRKLNLKDDELKLLAVGSRLPQIVPQFVDEDLGVASNRLKEPGQRIDIANIEAIKGRAASRAVTAREIARQYTRSVVAINSDRGRGTGFIVGGTGYIITCAHVIPFVATPRVSIQHIVGDKSEVEEVEAEIVRIDRKKDLALLKVDVKRPLRVVQFQMKGKVEAAENVTVIGNPGVGDTVLTNTVTDGIVSSVRREIDGEEFIQTSAAINPGNSGGPLFNDRGQVIGIVVAKARLENVGFAIPISEVLDFLRKD